MKHYLNDIQQAIILVLCSQVINEVVQKVCLLSYVVAWNQHPPPSPNHIFNVFLLILNCLFTKEFVIPPYFFHIFFKSCSSPYLGQSLFFSGGRWGALDYLILFENMSFPVRVLVKILLSIMNKLFSAIFNVNYSLAFRLWF